ncbi:MAG: aminotransferase class I/II-fold pyridoxal phosphate-dependent enzyme [Bdellovibrionota bacterium]
MDQNWLNQNNLNGLHSLKSELMLSNNEIVDLSMINPNLSPPRIMLDKLMEAETNPKNHRYSVSKGTKRLRESFVNRYRVKFGVELCLEKQVCVTFGTKDAVYNLLRCCSAPGELALLAGPSYPIHLAAVSLAGLKVSFFDFYQDTEELIASLIEKIERTKPRIILLNYPNNPTGQVFQKKDWERVVEAARKIDAVLINDFVYGELDWSNQSKSLLASVDDISQCVEIFSMSKAYNIPGWRVGAAIGCKKLITKLSQLKSYLDYGLYIPIQHAAGAGLDQGCLITKETKNIYQRRTQILNLGLEELGWETSKPKAGCSVWAKLPAIFQGLKSLDFCRELMQKTGILLGPGVLYGEGFDTHVRFACVHNERTLQDVISTIKTFQENYSN